MTKYLEKQLNQQRQLLHLELPATTANRRIKTLLGFPADTDDGEEHLYSLDYGGSLAVGALPTPASDTAKVAVKVSIITHFTISINNLPYTLLLNVSLKDIIGDEK